MRSSTAFRSDDQFTQRQFRRWVDARPRSDINHYELIDGRIVMTPPAGWTHGHVEGCLAQLLGAHVRSERLGFVFGSSAGYDLPSGDTLEPDASFVSTERFATRPPTRPDQLLRVAPNLVVEILSPDTARRDRTEKKEIYARNCVDEYWIVDPRRKTVTVFHLGDHDYTAGQTFRSGSVRSHVLPRLRISIAKLFTF